MQPVRADFVYPPTLVLANMEHYTSGGSSSPVHLKLHKLLPPVSHVWDKLVWNLYGQADILEEVN